MQHIALSAASNPEAYGSVGQSALYAVLGYVVVFIGLVLLMLVVVLMGKAMAERKAAQEAAQAAPVPVPAEPVRTGPPAPGSAGELKLRHVEERDAALLMAIVADQMGKPLNELRFKSIQEVSES